MNPKVNLDSWLVKLLGVEKFKPGLDRLFPFFENYITNFKLKVKIITVAGTNGKGETSFSIHHLLHQHGYRVATWSSPHIYSVTERYLINDGNVCEEILLATFKKLEKYADKLSYYEFLFLSFCELVNQRIDDLDYVILEVGLGGKFDTVNLFNADLALITSISRDHTEYLGNSLTGILEQKLGVSREGKKLIANLSSETLRSFIQNYCERKNIDLDLQKFSGDNYSTQNKKMAILAFNYICNTNIEILSALDELNDLRLKGRMEVISYKGSEFTFNGSHNLDGVRHFRDFCVSEELKFDYIFLAPSMRKKEEIIAMVKVLKQAKCLYNNLNLAFFTPHPRSCSKTYLEELKTGLNVIDWKDTIGNMGVGNKILILGSYYFIGEVQKFINE